MGGRWDDGDRLGGRPVATNDDDDQMSVVVVVWAGGRPMVGSGD